MRTNIEIDDALMAEAIQRSGLKTKRDVVQFVLNRYVNIERQREALEVYVAWAGTVISTPCGPTTRCANGADARRLERMDRPVGQPLNCTDPRADAVP